MFMGFPQWGQGILYLCPGHKTGVSLPQFPQVTIPMPFFILHLPFEVNLGSPHIYSQNRCSEMDPLFTKVYGVFGHRTPNFEHTPLFMKIVQLCRLGMQIAQFL